MHEKLWFESLKRRDHLEDLGIDGMIILKSILVKYGGRVWIGFTWWQALVYIVINPLVPYKAGNFLSS
jgi:hypothetical protein